MRAAQPVLHGEVLHRLKKQCDAFDAFERRLQAMEDVERSDPSLVQRFQVDENAAAVERRIGTVHADERREALHRRIFENDRSPDAC